MPIPVGAVLSLRWANPYTHDQAPFGVILWSVTIIGAVERQEADAWMRECCPDQRPGDGYSPTYQPPVQPIRRLSAEAKGRIRRPRLRQRLDAKLPLFAEQLYADALAKRPWYYAGEDPPLPSAAEPLVS